MSEVNSITIKMYPTTTEFFLPIFLRFIATIGDATIYTNWNILQVKNKLTRE